MYFNEKYFKTFSNFLTSKLIIINFKVILILVFEYFYLEHRNTICIPTFSKYFTKLIHTTVYNLLYNYCRILNLCNKFHTVVKVGWMDSSICILCIIDIDIEI